MDKILTTFLQVNLKVGKSLASAIEKGEQAADATKQAVVKVLSRNFLKFIWSLREAFNSSFCTINR